MAGVPVEPALVSHLPAVQCHQPGRLAQVAVRVYYFLVAVRIVQRREAAVELVPMVQLVPIQVRQN